jgi:coenzyme F420 hydrogenase subunit beta
MKEICDVLKAGLCVGCGICTYSDAIGKTVFSKKYDHNIPLLTPDNRNDELALSLCPGKGYRIMERSCELFNSSKYDPDLGYVYNRYAAFSNDREILKNASSGGIMSQTAIFLLERRIVDRVLTTQFSFKEGVTTKCILAGTRAEILQSQGSKYCPVDISEAIREIKSNNYRVAVIGTPCQIAGIRNIQKIDEEFGRKIYITIGNFCGGIKKFGNINLIAKRKGIEPSEISYFRFRGNGQPGSMMISDKRGKSVELPYPGYVGLTGIPKHLRCHLCVDATAELADMACGDAWLPRFLTDANPWSILLTRNRKADELVTIMKRLGLITTDSVSAEEIKKSQKENLTSKKVRQKSRYFLYKLLGYTIPEFDGGYHDNKINVRTEIIVFARHRIRSLLEKLHLFPVVLRLMKRYS